MDAISLHTNLVERGFDLSLQGRETIAVTSKERLLNADRQAIRSHKAGLLQVLRRSKPSLLQPSKTQVGGGIYSDGSIRFSWNGEEIVASRYSPGDGRIFQGYFSLDTETDIVTGPKVPSLALATASDGKNHVLIHPDDLAAFVVAHHGQRIVCHNVAFDFWVVRMHFLRGKATEPFGVWRDLVVRGRFHDTMLLDQLLRIGQALNEAPRDLGKVAAEYTGLVLNKDDPYRKRFGEIIGQNWDDVDPGFFEYAIPDAIATARAHKEMRRRARKLMQENGYEKQSSSTFIIDPKAVHKFGLLSEAVQVGAAIAFASIERRGLHTDQKQVGRTAALYHRRQDKAITQVRENWPNFFKVDKCGELIPTPKGGAFKQSNKELQQYLLHTVQEIEAQTGEHMEIPKTAKSKEISTSQKAWAPFTKLSPELRDWVEYNRTAKLSQFLGKFHSPTIRPHYFVLKKTGRTSCSSPNVQQVPRLDEFREMIIPSKGRVLLTVDYSFVELVTLAATCERRFGESRLAQIIRDGIDPHCYTAALFLGKEYDDFMRLKAERPMEFKGWRQMAKPINFGVPGGLGAEGLIAYALEAFGVKLSIADATAFRRRLITEVYPELELYLKDTSLEILSTNLMLPRHEVLVAFGMDPDDYGAAVGGIRKVVAGQAFKRDGTPHNEHYVARVWETLGDINQNPGLCQPILDRVGGPDLVARLFYTSVATLSGRVRGGVTYTSQRNTPFQGLAADGAKIALTNLLLAGFRVVAFVHDEILIELLDEGGFVSWDKVQEAVQIIRESMEEVTYGVPVACEYTVSTCWSKRAELLREGDRVLAWSPPRSDKPVQRRKRKSARGNR